MRKSEDLVVPRGDPVDAAKALLAPGWAAVRLRDDLSANRLRDRLRGRGFELCQIDFEEGIGRVAILRARRLLAVTDRREADGAPIVCKEHQVARELPELTRVLVGVAVPVVSRNRPEVPVQAQVAVGIDLPELPGGVPRDEDLLIGIENSNGRKRQGVIDDSLGALQRNRGGAMDLPRLALAVGRRCSG